MLTSFPTRSVVDETLKGKLIIGKIKHFQKFLLPLCLVQPSSKRIKVKVFILLVGVKKTKCLCASFTVMMKGTVLIISKRKDTWNICSQMFPLKTNTGTDILTVLPVRKQETPSESPHRSTDRNSPTRVCHSPPKHLILHLNQILQLTSALNIAVTNDSG